MQSVVCTIAVGILAFWLIDSTATAQQGSSTQQPIIANPASNPDQELGRRFLIKPENLPPPKGDPVAASRSLLIPYAGQTPRVMEGFTATPFVTGLTNATSDGGLHGHAICDGPGASSPVACSAE
jgi:hypothetical protein